MTETKKSLFLLARRGSMGQPEDPKHSIRYYADRVSQVIPACFFERNGGRPGRVVHALVIRQSSRVNPEDIIYVDNEDADLIRDLLPPSFRTAPNAKEVKHA